MSLQTIRNVENIESHVYALHTRVCRMQRDVSRKEDQGERRARCIYVRIVKEGRNYPGGKAKSVPVGSRFKLQPGRWWAPDHLDPLFHSKFVLPQGTRYALESSPWQLKIKDTDVLSFSLYFDRASRGRSFLEHIAALERQEETRMLSVVYLLGFFNPFLRTTTLIALIARGM